MGWTHCFDGRRKADGSVDRRFECDRLCTWRRTDESGNVISSGEVLKSAMVGSTYYAAVKDKDGKVWAAIFKTCGQTKFDHTAWGYKDMDETMGPYEDKCPASILALLSPTGDKDALAWRERCRKNIAKAAEIRRNGPKPIYAPSGIQITVEKQSWLITSEHYRATTKYTACRFTKRRWRDAELAVKTFLTHYGTGGQKAEWAASGSECPPNWRGAAA